MAIPTCPSPIHARVKSTDSGCRESKHVSFHSKVRVRRHIYLTDYTPEEIHQCWYKKSDFLDFQDDVRRTAHLIDSEFEVDEKGILCQRGAECKTKCGQTRKQRNRLKARIAIKVETTRQGELRDGEALAEVYKRATESASISARLAGITDAQEALSFVEADRAKEQSLHPSSFCSQMLKQLPGLRTAVQRRLPSQAA